VKRKMIRGSILGGKLLVAPVVGSLALVAGVVVLGLGCIALPVYGTYRLVKFAKKRKNRERNLTPATINDIEIRFPPRYQAQMPIPRTWHRPEWVEMPIKELNPEESPKWTEHGHLNSDCTRKLDSNSSLNTERTIALSTYMCTERSESNLRV